MQRRGHHQQLMGLLTALCAAAVWPTAASGHTATAEHHMIATVHPIARDAGAEIFHVSGNAVDDPLTAELTLGVVDGENSGIGGG